VGVVGSCAAVRQASKALQQYTVSLEGVKAGEARLAVNREQLSLPRGARVAARSPSTLTYTLEPVVTKTVPVRADLGGDLPKGYRLVRVTLDPKEIAIVGAKSSVRNIREVVTDRIELTRLRETSVLESSVALGYPHVWRKDPDAGPIRVSVEIEGHPDPVPGG
jgi:YbbR-like protein